MPQSERLDKRVSELRVEEFLVSIESKPIAEQRQLIADKIDLIQESLTALVHELWETKKLGYRDYDWFSRATKAKSVKYMQLVRLRSVLDRCTTLQAHRTFAERFVQVARHRLDRTTVQAIAEEAESINKGGSNVDRS